MPAQSALLRLEMKSESFQLTQSPAHKVWSWGLEAGERALKVKILLREGLSLRANYKCHRMGALWLLKPDRVHPKSFQVPILPSPGAEYGA